MAFRVRQGKRGLELRLHELEAAIMDVVWGRHPEPFTVAEVHGVLERRRDIAYTTVMTTVSRLFDKELLDRTKEGKRYVYRAKLSREGFLEATAREVLDGALGGQQAIAMLAEKVSEASAGELDALEALIRQRREELGE